MFLLININFATNDSTHTDIQLSHENVIWPCENVQMRYNQTQFLYLIPYNSMQSTNEYEILSRNIYFEVEVFSCCFFLFPIAFYGWCIESNVISVWMYITIVLSEPHWINRENSFIQDSRIDDELCCMDLFNVSFVANSVRQHQLYLCSIFCARTHDWSLYFKKIHQNPI